MLLQILIALFMGIIAGTITGLVPGIHTNLIGIFLVSLSVSFLSSINTIYFVVFIASMAITHTFVDFIPSIFLGCPDTDTELSILPGHELLKKGQGYQAIILTCYGSLAAILVLILISFPSITLISKIQNFIPTIIPRLLIIISFFLILTEKRKLTALFVFIISGLLGLCVLNFPSINQPLLPLLTGLFGSSMLIISIKNKTEIPPQEIIKPKTKILKPLIGAIVASPLCSFLPGLGSGQAAIIGNTISKNLLGFAKPMRNGTDKKGFLVLLGATNTLVMGFSFISLYAISKTRTGAAVAIQELISKPSPQIFILIMATIFISGIISFFITKFLAKTFAKRIGTFNYAILSLVTISILILITFFVSGFLGILVFIASTFTGIFCISLNVRRTNMMGCLLLPTIILYLMN